MKADCLLPSTLHSRPVSISAGFTLLELMISFTIIGLVLVLVFGALRIGARAWEKGERDVETHQRQRVVLDNIKRQIASMCLHETKVIDGEKQTQKKIFFKGDSGEMEFLSRIPMVPLNRSSMVYVKYRVGEAEEGEGNRLLLYEKDVVFIDEEEDLAVPEDAEYFELIPRAEEISFAYLKGPEDKDEAVRTEELEWRDEWDPDSDEGIPLAVKIALKQYASDSPIHVIVPLLSEADK